MTVFILCMFLGALLGLSREQEATTVEKPIQCGLSNLRNEGLQNATLEVKHAKPGNFPWHAGIYHRDKDSWAVKCGGTLITDRHVLTAAHCVTAPRSIYKPQPLAAEEVMVALGTINLQWNSTEIIKRKVNNINVHPLYFGSSFNYANDIALLELESGVAFNTNVLPACVDFGLSHEKQLLDDKSLLGYMPGWGISRGCTWDLRLCKSPSEELQFSQTFHVGLEECFNQTQAAKSHVFSSLTADKYCMANETGFLMGFSGGGQTFVFGGRHYIYGVASVKINLAQQFKFGTFTNVSFHLSWVNEELGKDKFPSTEHPILSPIKDNNNTR